ncbi:CTP synthase, partial [candidate division KSB1 bacterium]
ITGGVVSSLGKGIASASLGLLLKQRGLKVTILKLDPYLNVDPGTLSPYQHGEVFVTEDGAETDLDLGHYERFLDINLHQANNSTSGRIYHTVLERERKGEYLGKTVQVIPHVTDEIKRTIDLAASTVKDLDILIVELGGTVGDIEGASFLEAMRQYKLEKGRENVINIHLTLVPYIKTSGEIKTKPTQHSVQKLREIGIQPDIILCRTERELPEEAKRKIGLFCNVKAESVIEARDADSIYEVPILFEKGGLPDQVTELLNLKTGKVDLSEWENLVKNIKNPKKKVKIAVTGKYVELHDAYKSIMESFTHAGMENGAKVELVWVDSEEVEQKSAEEFLKDVSGLLVPGGFGDRGIEGKISAIKYARENNIPFFGICLRLQCAVIEFARSVCGLDKANSREFDDGCNEFVIDFMEEQKQITDKGGTMRLGAYPCVIKEGTLARSIYNKDQISERHRHRFEVNNKYRKCLKEHGMVISGTSPDNNLVEMIELPSHRFFIAGQFHPEFKSRALKPHPLFKAFVKAALDYKQEINKEAE